MYNHKTESKFFVIDFLKSNQNFPNLKTIFVVYFNCYFVYFPNRVKHLCGLLYIYIYYTIILYILLHLISTFN